MKDSTDKKRDGICSDNGSSDMGSDMNSGLDSSRNKALNSADSRMKPSRRDVMEETAIHPAYHGTLYDQAVKFSHDMGNLIVGLNGYLELLEQEDAIKDKGRHYFNQLLDLSSRATAATRGFSDSFSVISSSDQKSLHKEGEKQQAKEQGKKKKLHSYSSLMSSHRRVAEDRLQKRILVIDDDKMVREFIVKVLVSIGCEVTTALDGPQGLHLVQNGDYDCVLLDLCMPKMSGNLVFSRIRSDFPDLPVVFMSALISEVRLRKLSTASDFLFLEKPFLRGDLVNTISKACTDLSERPSQIVNC